MKKKEENVIKEKYTLYQRKRHVMREFVVQ